MPTVLIFISANKSFACESRSTFNSDKTSGLAKTCMLSFLMNVSVGLTIASTLSSLVASALLSSYEQQAV